MKKPKVVVSSGYETAQTGHPFAECDPARGCFAVGFFRAALLRPAADGPGPPLSEDREELLTTPYGINRVKIEGGKVRVTEADCPDKLCVYHPAATRSGEMIVCLPHKLVVQIEDGKTDPALPDGVAR